MGYINRKEYIIDEWYALKRKESEERLKKDIRNKVAPEIREKNYLNAVRKLRTKYTRLHEKNVSFVSFRIRYLDPLFKKIIYPILNITKGIRKKLVEMFTNIINLFVRMFILIIPLHHFLIRIHLQFKQKLYRLLTPLSRLKKATRLLWYSLLSFLSYIFPTLHGEITSSSLLEQWDKLFHLPALSIASPIPLSMDYLTPFSELEKSLQHHSILLIKKNNGFIGCITARSMLSYHLGNRKISSLIEDPVSLPPEASVEQALEVFVKKRVSYLLIMYHQNILGILYAQQLLGKYQELSTGIGREYFRRIFVADIAHHPLPNLFSNTHHASLISALYTTPEGAVVIVDQAHCFGIITAGDVLPKVTLLLQNRLHIPDIIHKAEGLESYTPLTVAISHFRKNTSPLPVTLQQTYVSTLSLIDLYQVAIGFRDSLK